MNPGKESKMLNVMAQVRIPLLDQNDDMMFI